MTCRKFRKQLIPWLDGELSPARNKEMKDRFDRCGEARHCTDCRKLAEEYRRFQHIFSHAPTSEFPAYLHHKIVQEIRQKEKTRLQNSVRRRWQLIPTTLAVLISLYFGSLVGFKAFTSAQTNGKDNIELYTFGENGMMDSLYTYGSVE